MLRSLRIQQGAEYGQHSRSHNERTSPMARAQKREITYATAEDVRRHFRLNGCKIRIHLDGTFDYARDEPRSHWIIRGGDIADWAIDAKGNVYPHSNLDRKA